MAIRAPWQLKSSFCTWLMDTPLAGAPWVNIFINDLDLDIRTPLERIQSLDHGNLIEQMSESKPTGPKWAKLNLTRIHEYKVLHLDEIKSSSDGKDLTWQWLKHKSLRWNGKIWEFNLTKTHEPKMWCECLKKINRSPHEYSKKCDLHSMAT